MRTFILIALVATCSAVQAQTPPTEPVAPKAVSFEDVLKWVSQGKDAPTILESCDTIFTFNFQETEKLRRAGAADALIDALQKKRMKLGDVRNIVLILDCSGSMSDKMPDGKTKMET